VCSHGGIIHQSAGALDAPALWPALVPVLVPVLPIGRAA
jgi:hypothetical protein